MVSAQRNGVQYHLKKSIHLWETFARILRLKRDGHDRPPKERAFIYGGSSGHGLGVVGTLLQTGQLLCNASDSPMSTLSEVQGQRNNERANN